MCVEAGRCTMGAWSVKRFVGVARLASFFISSENMDLIFVGTCFYG
jgi:hypothetical protein